MNASGLFRRILGPQFDRLAPRVREVHGGNTLRLRGRVTVTRGKAMLGLLIGRLASLPDAQQDAAACIDLVLVGQGETWTRHFGVSRPMRSHLHAREGLLVERLGPVQLRFRLHEHSGAIVWHLQAVSVLGIPAPRRWFAATTARSFEERGRYCFEVEVALPIAGHLIGYRGSIEVVA